MGVWAPTDLNKTYIIRQVFSSRASFIIGTLLQTQPFTRYGGPKFEQTSAFFSRLFRPILIEPSLINVKPYHGKIIQRLHQVKVIFKVNTKNGQEPQVKSGIEGGLPTIGPRPRRAGGLNDWPSVEFRRKQKYPSSTFPNPIYPLSQISHEVLAYFQY